MFKSIPFSYLWVFKNSIGANKSILDLGCGEGAFMKILSDGENWDVTGVEIFRDSVREAKKSGVYKNVLQGDIEAVMKDLICRKKKFDVVFCSHVIEHLPKSKGTKLLKLIDQLALKRAVIGTPHGFMEQIEEELVENNPHQAHLSGWTEYDFNKFKYRVHGVGFKLFWSDKGLARSTNTFISLLFRTISLILSPLVYYIPKLGVGLVAVKSYENQK